MLNKEKFLQDVKNILKSDFAASIEGAADYQKYHAVTKAIMMEVADQWQDTKTYYQEKKQAYYFSAEFLMGRAFSNNLLNLGIYDQVKEALETINLDINAIEEVEVDAGLGNGGLGRLAACFLDSAATQEVPLHGYGIRYEFGIFKQKFVDGHQVEEGDNWLKYGDPWSVRKANEAVTIEFGDQKVSAVPYDTPIIGYDEKKINTLRLWRSEPLQFFDFEKFNNQEYDKSVKEKNRAEDISRVLYPNDSKPEGKILRLKQQYFFVAASLQDLIRKHLKHHKTLENFPEFNAVQLNDTHPAVAIPEFMRLLTTVHEMEWEKAWKLSVKTFAYTNHTILAEALEQWPVDLFKKVLPEVYKVLEKIDQQFDKELRQKGYTEEAVHNMGIIGNGMIRMAWLSIYGASYINGVAQLHTEILKNQELADWYELYPEKFQNKTNGITQRRWLYMANRELSDFISSLLGSEDWIKNLDLLKGLIPFADDEEVLRKFLAIKKQKKEQLAAYIKEHEGIDLNVNSIFDIQIKRLHEYKRQLLNAFHILDLYNRLKADPQMDIVPRTFIFGAKAAPGYDRAKGIIKFINEIAKLVNNDPVTKDKITVVFVQNYRVTYGEYLFPAADLSEQISTAGKEASGTGNMKFMLNGAPTIGTLDGANVEIVEEAGLENNFIFGARVEEINEIYDSYRPKEYLEKVPGLKKVVDSLVDGTFSDSGKGIFGELHDALLKGASWHRADNYFILKDFDSYRKAQEAVDLAYRDELGWAKKCWLNIANAGKFSSDRTILQYAKEIWHV